MRLTNILICVCLPALVSCAGAPTKLDTTYGNSVRSMIYNQIADPAAAANPSPEAIQGLDGEKAEAVLSEHRNNVTKPDQVSNEITLNIGR